MTPEQRMVILRMVCDLAAKAFDEDDSVAVATSSYSGNRASENVKAAEAAVAALSPDGEREETDLENHKLNAECGHLEADVAELTAELADVRRQHEQTREERDKYANRCNAVESIIMDAGECFPGCQCGSCRIVRQLITAIAATLPASQAAEVHGE